jgi:hypothetical protein
MILLALSASTIAVTTLMQLPSTCDSQAAGHSTSQQPQQNACAPTIMLYRQR